MPPHKTQVEDGVSWETLRRIRDWAAVVVPIVGAIALSYGMLYSQVQAIDQNQQNHYVESLKQEERQDNLISDITLKVYDNSERISKLED